MRTTILRTAAAAAVIIGGTIAANAGGIHAPGLKDGFKHGFGPKDFGRYEKLEKRHKHKIKHGDRYDYGYKGHKRKHGKRHVKACLWPNEIRRKLRNRGWYGLRLKRLHPKTFVAHATRPSGLRFRIKVNRCRGRIVNAIPIGYRWY